MGLYEPTSCCICFDTKNGSLILASLSLIGAILSILSAGCGLLAFFLDAHLEQNHQFVQNHQLDEDDRDSIIRYVCLAAIVYYSFVGVFSSLLIHGIRKDRSGLMMPYLVFQRCCIIMAMISIFLLTVLAIYLQNPALFLLDALPLTMAATIEIYFHLVINAYHKQVKRAVSGGTVYYKEFHNDDNDYKGKV